ncbi:MAG: LysR family transcriptional regulator [Solirubrobacterales bacterium]|nr:LysR family transcriptional regulator [Solirubrobacterales bacterium]
MALDVRRLRVLRELAARGTIAATAEALSYTPSAVSQQLSTLEREAGVELLERHGRGVRLTDAGRLLARHADGVLARLEAAEAELEAAGRTVMGTLRVASFNTAARWIVPHAVAGLLASHPHVEAHVVDDDPHATIPALRLGEFDVVLGHDFPFEAPLRDPGFYRVDLFDDELHLAFGPSRQGLPADFAALEGVPWVAGHPGTSCHGVVVHACHAAGHEPRIVACSNDYGVILELVSRDLGVSLAPRIAHRLAPPGVRLERLDPPLHRRIHALCRAGAERRPIVAAFLDQLRAAVAREVEGDGRLLAARPVA